MNRANRRARSAPTFRDWYSTGDDASATSVPGGMPALADSAEIRQEALRSLEVVNSKLGELRDELTFFHERDLPAFNLWLESAFADLMTEIRRLFDRIAEKRSLVDEVGREAAKRRIGYRQAYEIVLKRRKEKAAGTQGDFWERGEDREALDDDDDDDDDGDRGERAGGSDRDERAARELFEEAMRDAGQDPEELDPEDYAERLARFRARNGFDGGSQGEGGGGREYAEADSLRAPRARPANEAEAQGLRRLYRQLARALHPDVSERRDAEAAQLWLDVQRAYENADVAMLAAIWERLRGPGAAGKGGGLGFVTVWDIHQKITGLLQSASKIERELRQAKRDRAWGFARPDRTRERRIRKLMPEVRHELERERDEVQEALDELEGFIDEWLVEDEGRRARRRGGRGDEPETGGRGGGRGRGRGRAGRR